jgi:hypothetical protein
MGINGLGTSERFVTRLITKTNTTHDKTIYVKYEADRVLQELVGDMRNQSRFPILSTHSRTCKFYSKI